MLRLLGFFLLALLLANVLGHVPLIGGFFRATGIFGIWIAAILLSVLFTRLGERLYRRRRDAVEERRLAAVASPRNLGKLGSMYLLQGRARRAIDPLRRAVEGEPDVPEWHYRLAQALARIGQREEALVAIERCLALDEEHAYGQPQLHRAEWRGALGDHEAALESLSTFERNHGPTPESAFRRGVTERALGRKDEARRSFAEVPRLAAEAPGYQRSAAIGWVLRAALARLT